jgi:hypothetical protein
MKCNELEEADFGILGSVLLVVYEEDRQAQKLMQLRVCNKVNPEE